MGAGLGNIFMGCVMFSAPPASCLCDPYLGPVRNTGWATLFHSHVGHWATEVRGIISTLAMLALGTQAFLIHERVL